MPIFGGLWDAALAIFVILFIVNYAGLKTKKSGKAYGFITAAGVLMLVAAGSLSMLSVLGSSATAAANMLAGLFSVISYILLLIGGLSAAYEYTKMK